MAWSVISERYILKYFYMKWPAIWDLLSTAPEKKKKGAGTDAIRSAKLIIVTE